MGRHIIEGPDGKRHIIEAPDDARPEEIEAFANQSLAPSQAESLGRGAVQGVTFGFGDEIYGAAKGAYDKVLGSGDYSGTYERERDAVRSANDRAQQANPGTYLAGEIVGGVAVPGAAAKLGYKGVQAANAGLKARSVAAAKEGAAFGGLYGLGKGEGDFGDQALSTVSGAALGGTFGAAVPGAVQLGSAVLRAPAQAVRVAAQPQRVAAEKVSEAFARDAGENVTGVAPVLRAEQRLSQEAARGENNLILADMGGQNVKDLTRAATNMPNARNERFSQVLNRRQAVEGRRLGDVLQKTLAGGEEFTAALDDLVATRTANAKPAFEKAYDAPLATGTPADEELSAFFGSRKYMERLLVKTLDNIEGVTGKTRNEMKPWEILHRVKMQINREIGSLKRGQQDSVASWSIGDLTRLNQEYGRLLSKHNRQIGGALKQFSDESALINSLEEGADDFFKLSPEELAKKIRTLSKDEADLYRVGATRAQVEKLRSGDVMRDRTKSLYGSDDIGMRLKAVFPAGPERGEFLRTIGAARKMAATRRAAQGNSTTAKQLINAQEAGKGIRTAADAVGAMKGSPGAIANFLERGYNFASGITPGVASEILNLSMQKGGGQAGAKSSQAMQAAFERALARTRRQGQATNALVPAESVLSSEFGRPGPSNQR